jgi:hypothetical protein
MAEEDYSYYSGEGQGWKRYGEGLIPILILIALAVVLLGKTTTFFCGTPGLTDIFCGQQTIRIAVIGDFNSETVGEPTNLAAPKLQSLLDSYLGSTYNMNYQTFDTNLLIYAKEALIKNYDMVILVGDRAFTRPVKDAIGYYVANGGKLIVLGDAAVRDPDDPLYIGWGGGMFDSFPVQLNPNDRQRTIDNPIIIQDPILNLLDIDHQIVQGYGVRSDLTEVACNEIPVLDVQPTQGGSVIAILSQGTGAPSEGVKNVPGIVESASLFGGRIIYFAYDPGCTPNLWISTVGYLTNKI